ncbi:MAG: FMN-binding protein [Bacillota bacterium]|nr:FMN-binding protein [Bacillota bacterium]
MGRKSLLVMLICAALCCAACSAAASDTALDQAERQAAAELLPDSGELTDISAEALNGERGEKFAGLTKVYRAANGDYFICAAPYGYGGVIEMAVAIDTAAQSSVGIRILAHSETEHYVRDFQNDWFTGRFSGKSVYSPLYSAHLGPENEREIIIITGSTQTTDAVILGVNAAFGLFRELELGEQAEAVPAATDIHDYDVIILLPE